jgi:hypothetical protein
MLGAESRQGWVHCHLRVKSEGEFARGRPAGGGDQAMICAVEPSLEITEDPMHPRPAAKLLSSVMLSLGGIAIAHASERCVGFPAVDHVRAPGFAICGDEACEGWCSGVSYHLEAHPAQYSAVEPHWRHLGHRNLSGCV